MRRPQTAVRPFRMQIHISHSQKEVKFLELLQRSLRAFWYIKGLIALTNAQLTVNEFFNSLTTTCFGMSQSSGSLHQNFIKKTTMNSLQ